MRSVFAVMAAVAVTIGGCSGTTGAVSRPGSSAAPSMDGSATTVPTPAPAKPLSQKQAAIRYLKTVKPYDIALERLEQAINTGRPAATLRELAAKVASANAAHMRDLRDVPWPLAVRAPIKALRAESAKAQVYWRQAAQAKTRGELVQAVLEAARHDGSVAAGKIRSLLHLAKYEESVYS
ncbi:hypothetical protein Pth03_38710 [Planotetraspora thailandica]|uniref:Uncharacterized protein n=1 Tax=Planotetraspora thailandica TaxID=487172 RepID=A0A8J3V4N6_9ACTN|nr:hypothetical protein [Planotetraspora thailandica]GII55482.1 hypothetical protein Pth03_38710 [Planotetraspora thailandica]